MERKESLYTGVYTYNKTKWASCIRIGSRRKYLGVFDTEIEAHLTFLSEYNKLDEETKKKVSNKQKINIYE